MTRFISRLAGLGGVLLLCCVALGCQQTPRPAADLPPLAIGVVAAIQPMGTTDLMAGFIPEGRTLASADALASFDTALADKLRADTKRTYTFLPAGEGTDPTAPRTARGNTALDHWTEVAKEHGLDLLIVPQILDWNERQGGAAGVSTSAAVNMDFFLIDAREEGQLINRSHYNEKQVGLSDNLMDFGTFFKRGAKWLTAQELAMEAVDKMIREFGL